MEQSPEKAVPARSVEQAGKPPDSGRAAGGQRLTSLPELPGATPAVAVCDGCDSDITAMRHKCDACPDFDYCSKCFLEAPLVHPGHSFTTSVGGKALDAAPVAPSSASGHDEPARDAATEAAPVPYECRSCAGVTKTLPALPALVRHKSLLEKNGGVPPRNINFEWPVRISRLIEATQKGCAFCSFVLYKFFGPSNAVTFGYRPTKPWYADPANSKHDGERADPVKHCMGTLTKLKHDRFGFAAQPLCRRIGSSLPDFDTLRIHVSSLMGRDKSEIRRIFNSSGVLELVTDVYAERGTDVPAPHLEGS